MLFQDISNHMLDILVDLNRTLDWETPHLKKINVITDSFEIIKLRWSTPTMPNGLRTFPVCVHSFFIVNKKVKNNETVIWATFSGILRVAINSNLTALQIINIRQTLHMP